MIGKNGLSILLYMYKRLLSMAFLALNDRNILKTKLFGYILDFYIPKGILSDEAGNPGHRRTY